MIRLPILIALVLVTTMPVSAQDPTPNGGIDPVQAAIAADAATVGCDDIGFSVLTEELNSDTVDVAHHAACHHGVEALLMASCYPPFSHDDLSGRPDGPAPGELHLFCNTAVISVSDAPMVVDPADFFLIDENQREIGVALDQQAQLPEDTRFSRETLKPEGVAEGNLLFVVEEPLASPFLLAWEPPTLGDPPFVVIVIDRFNPI